MQCYIYLFYKLIISLDPPFPPEYLCCDPFLYFCPQSSPASHFVQSTPQNPCYFSNFSHMMHLGPFHHPIRHPMSSLSYCALWNSSRTNFTFQNTLNPDLPVSVPKLVIFSKFFPNHQSSCIFRSLMLLLLLFVLDLCLSVPPKLRNPPSNFDTCAEELSLRRSLFSFSSRFTLITFTEKRICIYGRFKNYFWSSWTWLIGFW